MAKPVRVLVLRAAGINCDEEAMHCWHLAGAEPTLVHLYEFIEKPFLLDGVSILTIPGGFSYGDDIAAGVIFAQRMMLPLAERILSHVERGGGVLGICNGFQILVKAGLIPGGAHSRQRVSVTNNIGGAFVARWVRMVVTTDKCPFLTPGATIELPVEHAEGRVVAAHDGVLAELAINRQIALRYQSPPPGLVGYPPNPNGSMENIAGLCDNTGRIFGLMPHPDRYFHATQYPAKNHPDRKDEPDGLMIFNNAVAHWRAQG